MAPAASTSLHLPPFQAKDVRFWFLQVEAKFRTAKVTDDQTKFDHVITAMDVTAAADIRDLIDPPPEENVYQTLKDALISRLEVSEKARIQRLLSNEQMGDRKPSQHLRYLRSLAGTNFSGAALLSIWQDALPSEVKMIVAGAPNLTTDQLADMADRIMDVALPQRRSVAAVTNQPAAVDPMDALVKKVDALSKKFNSFSRSAGSSTQTKRANTTDNSASVASTAVPAASKKGICWYHLKFQEEAQKCTPPCSWKAPAGNGQSQQ